MKTHATSRYEETEERMSVETHTDVDSNRSMYLELLKRAVSGRIVEDPPRAKFPVGKPLWAALFAGRKFDAELRDVGRDWPSLAHTMIGTRRLDNLQRCIEDVLGDAVPGDLIETGVWRGGATIFMRGVLKAYGADDRCVWVADSFAGLPRPDAKRYPFDRGWNASMIRYLAVSQEEVQANFTKYGLLDERVRFLKGYFRDSLPGAPIGALSILRLDGDLYESTMEALTHLYPKLSVGGFVIVDDYALRPCAEAVRDYRTAHGICEPIVDIDGVGAYWRRLPA
jgi:hypothetical protein